MLRLVHSQDGEICVSGHSVVNDDEARSWYSYSVWDMNEKTCIQRITLEESQADFSGESEWFQVSNSQSMMAWVISIISVLSLNAP